MTHGLGRLPAPDERDTAFPMAAAIPETPPRTWRYWGSGWHGDQGARPYCVGYSWAHWIEDGPVTQPGTAPVVAPERLYAAAQLVDEWEGAGYSGTSVRAGAKVLQAEGWIGGYTWAWDADTVVRAVLSAGPVVVGTDWYDGMFHPDAEGLIEPTGTVVGGHAYLINGANLSRGTVRIKNSWGRDWGRKGTATMRITDLDYLIRADGEACLATEIRMSMEAP